MNEHLELVAYDEYGYPARLGYGAGQSDDSYLANMPFAGEDYGTRVVSATAAERAGLARRGQVYSWRARGRLRPVVWNADQRPCYLVTELERLAAEAATDPRYGRAA